MPILRYTLRKILVSPSTWVVLILTILILGLTWGLMAYGFTSGNNIVWTPEMIKNMFITQWQTSTFLTLDGLMLLIFIGIKSVQIFRDEIDDGTLLILVSKPISRNRIWIEKWLCFQIVIIVYLLLVTIIPSLIFLVPDVSNTQFFTTLFPYILVLFGVSIIFDLIFTSVVLLISLVLNAKAVIAIMIGIAALMNIFVLVVDTITVQIPSDYFTESQAVAVYQKVQKSLGNSDSFSWFKLAVNDSKIDSKTNQNEYIQEMDDLMVDLYGAINHDVSPTINYPISYSYTLEQKYMNNLANGKLNVATYQTYFTNFIDKVGGGSEQGIKSAEKVASYVINISNVFRQSSVQSYQALMTGVTINVFNSDDFVNYSVMDVNSALTTSFSKSQIDNMNSKVTEKRILRYFNVFYQLSYLFNGIINQNNDSLFTSNYQKADDPYLISFKPDASESSKYIADTSTGGTTKILNFTTLLVIYIIIAVGLSVSSWYVFKRRDFA